MAKSTSDSIASATATSVDHGSSLSISPECLHGYVLRELGRKIGLDCGDSEDVSALASRCHYRIDVLIREHAERIGAWDIVELMDLHDEVGRLAP